MENFLGNISNIEQLSSKAHILLLGYYLRKVGRSDFSPTELKEAFREATIPCPKPISTRVSQLTKGQKPPILRIKQGKYSLSIYGIREVEDYFKNKPENSSVVNSLENIKIRIKEKKQNEFLEEALRSFQAKAKRATVVMSWLLVMDHLQELVIKKWLNDFNNELVKRSDVKIKAVIKKDDFSEFREEIFIEVLRAAKIISNDVRKILIEKLGIRNTCAHPADILIHETKVINFIEDLIDNVILKYPNP
jgi:hypothetical protein